MSLLVRTTHYTYCPYKGDCTYYSIPIGGSNSEYALWTYEKPFESVASIKEYLALFPSRVDSIQVISYTRCTLLGRSARFKPASSRPTVLRRTRFRSAVSDTV